MATSKADTDEVPRQRGRFAAPEPVHHHVAFALFLVLAIALAAVVYGPLVRDAVFQNDSLGMFRTAKRNLPFGEQLHVYSWMSFRPLGIVYWPGTFEVLGLDPRVHLGWTVAIAVALSSLLFAFLRELGAGRLSAGAIGLLFLLLPIGDAARMWSGASSNTLAVCLWLGALLVALRAFDASGRWRWVLHAVSLLLLVASLLLYEVAALATLATAALYLFKGHGRAGVVRALADAALAVAVLVWVKTHSIYDSTTVGASFDRVRPFFGQVARLCADTVVPFWTVPTAAVILGVLLVLALSLAQLWRSRGDLEAAAEARRWLTVGTFGTAVAAAGWLILLPSPFWPLGTGQATRVNAFAGVGFLVFLFAVAALAGAAAGSLVGRPRMGALLVAPALMAALAIGWLSDLRADLGQWRTAAAAQKQIVSAISDALGRHPPKSTVFTFGHAIETMPGLPIIAAPWDLQGALSSLYPPQVVSGFPMHPGTTIDCRADRLQAHNHNDHFVRQVARYGEAVFVDVATGRTVRIDSQAQCARVAPTFQPGPQYLAPDDPLRLSNG